MTITSKFLELDLDGLPDWTTDFSHSFSIKGKKRAQIKDKPSNLNFLQTRISLSVAGAEENRPRFSHNNPGTVAKAENRGHIKS